MGVAGKVEDQTVVRICTGLLGKLVQRKLQLLLGGIGQQSDRSSDPPQTPGDIPGVLNGVGSRRPVIVSFNTDNQRMVALIEIDGLTTGRLDLNPLSMGGPGNQ
jgi:hypothetical protein